MYAYICVYIYDYINTCIHCNIEIDNYFLIHIWMSHVTWTYRAQQYQLHIYMDWFRKFKKLRYGAQKKIQMSRVTRDSGLYSYINESIASIPWIPTEIVFVLQWVTVWCNSRCKYIHGHVHMNMIYSYHYELFHHYFMK